MKKIQVFVEKNSIKILVTIIVALVLDLLSQFPYLGAFLVFPYPIGKFFVLFMFIAMYFRTNAKFSRILALFWFGFAFITSLFRRDSISESAGVACIMLLAVSFLQEWYEQRKKT